MQVEMKTKTNLMLHVAFMVEKAGVMWVSVVCVLVFFLYKKEYFYFYLLNAKQQSINWQIVGQLCCENVVIIKTLDCMFNFDVACVYILWTWPSQQREEIETFFTDKQ